MASIKSVCGVCDFRHVTSPAVVWCSECEEGLCDQCKDHHSASKSSRNHTTTPITEYQKLPSFILKIKQFCSKHNEKLVIFCNEHGGPCCSKCVVEDHKPCQDIANISDIVHDVKLSNAFIEIDQILEEMSANIEIIRKDRQENLCSISEGQKRIEEEIREFRIKINDHLDKLQESFLKELKTCTDKEVEKINQVLNDLQMKETDVKEYKTQLINIKQHASDLQAYLGLKQLENSVSNVDTFMQSLDNSGDLNQIEISCKISESVTKMVNELQKFGDVVVGTKPQKVRICRRKDKQAQILMTKVRGNRNIKHLNLKLQKTISTYNNYGCCLLPDGRMVFSHHTEKKISVLKNDGKVDFVLNFPTYTLDVCFIQEDNTIAVTSGYDTDSRIYIVDLQKREIQKHFTFDSHVHGLASKGRTLICSCNKGLYQVNLGNGDISCICNITLPGECLLAVFDENIYYTNNKAQTVTCCDFQGKIKWECKDQGILNAPIGITVDNAGNLFVVGFCSRNLIVFSPDGQSHRKILSEKDGLERPYVLDYDTTTDRLLITSHLKKAFLYTVSETFG